MRRRPPVLACLALGAASALASLPACTHHRGPAPLPLWSATRFARLPTLQTELAAERLDHALLSAAMFHETNRVRRAHGLRPFTWLAQLDAAADLQANSVTLDQTAGHFNLLPSLHSIADRLEHVGLPPGGAAENAALLPFVDIDPAHGIQFAQGANPPVLLDAVTGRPGQPHTYATFAAAAIQAWMDSPGHRANILNPELSALGCSGRTTKRISSVEMVACIQVFYTAPRPRRPR